LILSFYLDIIAYHSVAHLIYKVPDTLSVIAIIYRLSVLMHIGNWTICVTIRYNMVD